MSVSPEQFLISSILRDSDFQVAMSHGIAPEMFHGYEDEWRWIESYFLKHRKVPTKAAFKTKFPEFRVKAVNDTGYFADEVRKNHARHSLTAVMREAADFIADGDLDTAIKKMSTEAIHVASGMGYTNDGDIFSANEDIVQDINARRERQLKYGSAGIPTGFPTLDERTGGPQPGELWIVGARLGEGKSYTMQRMACAAVMNGFSTQFDALEQSRAQVAMRIYSMMSGSVGKSIFSSTSLMQGKDYDPANFRKFMRQLKEEVKGALHVSDATRGRVGVVDLAAQIERNNPRILFVDYITLMKKNGMEWQGVAELSSEILGVANQYQLPIVAAAQLNREHGLSKEPPGPEALAQADAIGQDATAVITMKKLSARTIVMKMVKNRNGRDGFRWYCHFDPSRGIFEEVSFNKAQALIEQDKDAEDEEASNR